MGQWVHRQGVHQVAALSHELAAAEPEGWAWWQAQQVQTSGPEPLDLRQSGRSAPIDYEHYLTKQLEPVADAILPFVGDSFARLGGDEFAIIRTEDPSPEGLDALCASILAAVAPPIEVSPGSLGSSGCGSRSRPVKQVRKIPGSSSANWM